MHEDGLMDIHKPKPWHGWREFLKEFVTIVLGVSVALAAEQGVEWLHNNQRAEQARDGIRTEIAAGVGRMAARDKFESCVSRRLDEAEGLIADAAAGKLPSDPIWIGRPFLYVIEDYQYKTATQSGAADLLPNQEQATYSRIYNAFSQYSQAEQDEQAAWGDLRVLEKHPAPSPVLEWQLRSALQKARLARWTEEATSRGPENIARTLGITVTPLTRNRSVTNQSVCIPIHTPRAEAEKTVAAGRATGALDEP